MYSIQCSATYAKRQVPTTVIQFLSTKYHSHFEIFHSTK